jgi:hypothetical protein
MKYTNQWHPLSTHHLPFLKPASYKYYLALLIFVALTGCLSGKKPLVKLSPKLDKRLYQITPLPLTVGVYIEPELRTYIQQAPLKQYEPGTPYYVFPDFVFPVGRHLSEKIEEMSKIVFERIIRLDSLQDKDYLDKQSLDGILVTSLNNSEIELRVDVSVWRAVGEHKLSLMISFLDSNLNKIWESEVSAEAKGLDFITSKVEHEWWITTGPDFSPAVEETIKEITYKLAQKLVTSEEITSYIRKENSK